MRKTNRRSIAAALSAICAILLALGCGSGQPTPPPGLNETQLAGWQAYVDLKCAGCHGDNREGKRSGPPLTGLSEHWTPDELVLYLSDPDAVVKANPRLAYKAEKYAISMPAISGKAPGYADKATPEALAAIAEYMMVDPPASGD
jgi:mono/diheme cytochrome c family protein